MSIVINESFTDVSVADDAVATVNGDGDAITAGAGATLTVNGYDDTINASDDTLTVNDNGGPGNTVNGSFDNFTVPINSIVTVNGTHETINDAGHGYLYFTGGAGSVETISGTVLEIKVPADFHLQFTGTQNDFYLGDHCVLTVTGDDDNLFGADDRFYLTGSIKGGDEIVGDHDRAVLTGAVSQLLLYGNYEVLHCGVDTSLAVMTGSDDRFIGAGFYVLTTGATDVWIGGNGLNGAADTLTGSNMTAVIGGNSNIVMTGDDDIVAMRLDSHLYFVGAGLTAHLGYNDSLAITGKGATSALDTLTGAHCSVNIASAANVELATTDATATVGNGVALTLERSYNTITAYTADTIDILWGVSNQITVGVDDVITDGGAGTSFDVVNFVGATTLDNFAADPLGIVDLMNGIGGFASAQDAFAALTSDGAGGLKLSLGGYGSLDFAGDTSLSAANFKIG